MPRIKNTARMNPDTRPAVGESAVFEPRTSAVAPNIFQCSKCERRYSNVSNLNRHEKQMHGPQLFKFPCPASPARSYNRRSDLREHYRVQHPDADIEEIDDIEPVEIPREAVVKRPAPDVYYVSEEHTSIGPTKKKPKNKSTSSGSNPECGDTAGSSSRSAGLEPMSTSQLNAIASGAGNRLMKITEKIIIEREYQFQQV